ncbi:MAG TPA: hypothetical protein VI160_06320 [Gemmatimonadales bacterium]
MIVMAMFWCACAGMTERGRVTVAVTPREASVVAGGAVAFTASVSGASGAASTAVTWSVQEPGGGIVDDHGLYTAPGSAGVYHVTVASALDPSATDTSTVTVSAAAAAITVAVAPRNASTTPGGALTFSATVGGARAGQSTAVTWSVAETSGGMVDASGHYTAPTATGTFHVVATSVADASTSATATVVVTATPVVTVSVSPGSASVVTAATAQFTATVTGTTGAQSTAVNWSVQEAGGGAVDAAGKYTAPAVAGTFHVVATSVADPSKSDAAAVSVIAPGAIDQSILPEMYRTAWDPGIPGGIPADNDPVRPATVWLPAGNPYGGYSVNPALTGTANAAAFTAAFQAAINAAGAAATPSSRRIVLLKAGTYFVNPQVNSGGQVGIYVKVDNVTIRGEGADSTRLAANGTINDYGTVVLFGHRSGSSDASFAVQNLTADAPRGSRTIQVASAAGYAVGDVVTIDHLDGAPVANGPAMLNGGYIWFYDGEYFKRQPTFGWSGPSTGAPAIGSVSSLATAATAAQNAVPRWRSTMQTDEIAAISGNVLTLKDPLNIDFPLSTSPQVWRTVPLDTGSLPLGNRWSGIENIAVAGGNNLWGFPGGTVVFSYMAYAWAKNIEADGEKWNPFDPAHPGKYGYNIGVGRSYRVVVRDSYVHGSADENPGGQAYGIVIGAGSSACLVENNISVENNKPIALNSTGGGNVIAYNYVDQAVLWNSPGWQESGIDDCHANFTHHDLIEGNWTPNLGADTTHGNSGWHTHLRNYANGRNSRGAVTGNLRAVGMDGWTHYHAYIGNVLQGGTVYQTTPGSQAGTPVFQLGNNWGGSGGNWDNGYALAHVYRDGNWDNVSRGVVWATAARSIPSSFYLTGKPSFFGANAWPWVDPIAGTVSTLPAKARYDAGTPNLVR